MRVPRPGGWSRALPAGRFRASGGYPPSVQRAPAGPTAVNHVLLRQEWDGGRAALPDLAGTAPPPPLSTAAPERPAFVPGARARGPVRPLAARPPPLPRTPPLPPLLLLLRPVSGSRSPARILSLPGTQTPHPDSLC